MPTPSLLLRWIVCLLIVISPSLKAAAADSSDGEVWHGWLVKHRGVVVRPHQSAGRVRYETPKLPAPIQARIDSRLVRAASIAEARAQSHSIRRCWQYVKTALLKADAVKSYPQTAYAKQAARELVTEHGFVRLPVRDPARAPVGAVLVYGGNGAGHVEIRTPRGFVSDYRSAYPCALPFIGAYAKGS